jgi:hypothetical protein
MSAAARLARQKIEPSKHNQGVCSMNIKLTLTAIAAALCSLLPTGAVADVKEQIDILRADLDALTFRVHQLEQASQPKFTIFVPGDDDPEVAGNALLAAIAEIGLSGPCATTPTTPCHVKLGPGVFDVGPNSVELKDSVVIEGSGSGVTVVRGTETVVTQLSNVTAELREVAVLSNSTVGIGIRMTEGSLKLEHVDVTSPLGLGILASCTQPCSMTQKHVSVKSALSALQLNDNDAHLTDVTTEASDSIQGDGVFVGGTRPIEISNSSFRGVHRSFLASPLGGGMISVRGSRLVGDVTTGAQAPSAVDLATSQIVGNVTADSTGLRCALVYDADLNLHPCVSATTQ